MKISGFLKHKIYKLSKNFLVVQWLGYPASTAGSVGSIPGLGTKILHDTPLPPAAWLEDVLTAPSLAAAALAALQLYLQLASRPEGKQEAGLRQPSAACQPTSSSHERFARRGKKPGGCEKWKGVFPDPNPRPGPAYQDCTISFSSSRAILFSILQEVCQLQSSACLPGVQGE